MCSLQQAQDVVVRARGAILHLERSFQISQRVGYVAAEEEFCFHCRACLADPKFGALKLLGQLEPLRRKHRGILFDEARSLLTAKPACRMQRALSFRDQLAWPVLVVATVPPWTEILSLEAIRDPQKAHILLAIQLAARGFCLTSARIAEAFLAEHQKTI